MKKVEIQSPLDKALASGAISPTNWAKQKRKEIETDIRKRFPSLKQKRRNRVSRI